MKTQTQKALELAIESFFRFDDKSMSDKEYFQLCKDASFACKKALEQESASLGDFDRMTKAECVDYIDCLRKEIDLLQFKKWKKLTDEEIEYWECLKAPPVHPDFIDDDSWIGFARSIEQALRIKNDYQS